MVAEQKDLRCKIKKMDKVEVRDDAGLRTAWQAESVFIQWLAFSLTLVTLALTFQHISKTKIISLQRITAISLSLALATVAVSFGAVALFIYTRRMSRLTLENSSEAHVHIIIVCMGVGLLLCECAFVATMMLTTSGTKRA